MHYLIVGTGPSVNEVKDFDYSSLPDNVIVVSVNTSIMFLNYANLWFSIDSSQRNIESAILATKRKIPTVWCLEHTARVRNISERSIFFKKKSSNIKLNKNPVTPEDWLARWGSVKGLSEKRDTLHNGNSLYSCLNLVYFDKPEKIAILGLDGSLSPSIGGNHKPNNLSHLPILFSSTVSQLKENDIQVVNGSKNSAITCFERSSPLEAIEWISTP